MMGGRWKGLGVLGLVFWAGMAGAQSNSSSAVSTETSFQAEDRPAQARPEATNARAIVAADAATDVGADAETQSPSDPSLIQAPTDQNDSSAQKAASSDNNSSDNNDSSDSTDTAALPGPAPLVEAPGSFDYPTVAAALAALRIKPGVQLSTQDGWVIAVDPEEQSVWSFTPSNHPAYPAAVHRWVGGTNGQTTLEMKVLCQSKKEVCDDLVREFQALNQRTMNQSTSDTP